MAKKNLPERSFEVFKTAVFDKKLKKFSKGDRLLKDRINDLIENLKMGVLDGDLIDKNIYKKRVQRQGKGQSGGYRVAYFVAYSPDQVYLLTMLDKKEEESFDPKLLKDIVKALGV